MTRILPWRRMILHLSHIFLTEGRTFMSFPFGMRIVLYVHAQPLASVFSAVTGARRIRVFARGAPYRAGGGLLEAVGDAAAVQVVHRQLHGHAVAGQDP